MTARAAQATVYKALPQAPSPLQGRKLRPKEVRVTPGHSAGRLSGVGRKSTPSQKFTYMQCLAVSLQVTEPKADASGQTQGRRPSLLPKGLSPWP